MMHLNCTREGGRVLLYGCNRLPIVYGELRNQERNRGEQVRKTIHRNLNVGQALKKPHLLQGSYSSGCLWVITPCSEAGSPNGRVEGYTQYACLLDARAKVGSTPARVKQGRRAVFARIHGITSAQPMPHNARGVSFNPFQAERGFYWKDTGEACSAWRCAWFTPSGMFAV